MLRESHTEPSPVSSRALCPHDKPSWVSQKDVNPTKTAHENAKQILDTKYGSGNWKNGPKTEYNQIVKWINRTVRAYIIEAGRQRRGK